MARRPQFAPLLLIVMPLIMTLFIAACVLVYALHQPWLGLHLSAIGDQAGVQVTDVAREGPSAALPDNAVLAALSGRKGQSVDLMPFDATEDPDLASAYTRYDRFFERQTLIFNILSQDQVTLRLADGQTFVIAPRSSRPLSSLPPEFWVLLATGLAGIFVGSWTLGVSRGVDAVKIWALGGVALVLSTFPSAIFITRELALDGPHFRFLSTVNFFGSLSFCVLLLAMFLIYPRRLMPQWSVVGLLVFTPVWCLFEFYHFGLSGPELGRYLPVAIMASSASLVAFVQFVLARNEPLERAAVGWFGLSIAICTGIFVVLYAVPSVIGRAPDVPQWISYALAFVVHTGLALGISRYRLFDLEPWAFRILFYVGGTAVFAVLDILLVAAVSLEALPAFGLALGAVVFFYLPLRDTLLDRLMPERRQKLLFREVIDVALAMNMVERNARWAGLMQNAFNPLEIAPMASDAFLEMPRIEDDGLSLNVPAVGAVTPLHLSHAHAGRRLFSPRHLEIAEQLCDMLAYASESRSAYERGTHEERSRIARDMHDNIGARLLTALHSTAHERKDAMIRDALSELRGIINNISGATQSFEDSLADMRLEAAERLSDAGLELEWQMGGDMAANLSPVAAHAMRSIVREGVSNTLRHANATQMHISIVLENAQLAIEIRDDGTGSEGAATGTQGLGLVGINARLERLNGRLQIDTDQNGFSLSAEFPLLPVAAE